MSIAWSIILLASLCVADAPTTRPVRDVSVDQLLREANSRRELAVRALGQLEGRVDAETHRIMQTLDNLMAGEITRLFQAHYAEVERKVQDIGLPEDVGRWGVAWRELKAGIGAEGALKQLCENYITEAVRQLEPLQEQFTRQIEEAFGQHLKKELQKSQEDIRNDFQQVIIRHFPVWGGANLPPPPLPRELLPAHAQDDSDRQLGLAALAGVLAIVAGRIIRRVIPKLVAKMVGRVLVKLLPIVGALLSVWDVWDASQARNRLETTLRSEFVSGYKEGFRPDDIWTSKLQEEEKSFRESTREDVRSLLTQWASQCREEAQATLDAAHVLEIAPNIRAYLEAQERLGRNSEQVVQDLVMAWNTFGRIVANEPIDELLNMLVHADQVTLRLVGEQLGTQLIELYRQHGSVILQAAEVMGPDTFVVAARSERTVRWTAARDAFQRLPKEASRDARRGLFLLIREGIDETGVPESSLERAAQNEAMFLKLAPILQSDRNKLLSLLTDARVREAIEDGLDRDIQATAILVNSWEMIPWQRYRDKKRREALYAVINTLRDTQGKDAICDFAETLKDEDPITPIYMDVGRNGLLIRMHWVKADSGEHQKQLAQRAIVLLKEGYPCDSLMTREGIELAELCEHLPVAGSLVFNMAAPFGSAAKVVVTLIILLLFSAVLALILRLFFWSRVMNLLHALRPPPKDEAAST